MDKKEEIKRLKKEKKYEEIYEKFGQEDYIKNASYSYRKKDLAKLIKNGKFEDIFNKYGNKKYNKILSKAKYAEIKQTKGTKSAIMWKIGRTVKIAGLYLGITSSAFTLSLPAMNETTVKENKVKYEKEIQNYDNKIKEYAKEVNSMDLDDTQIFMKVMDDMWHSIKGYKEPELDISGFLELDLADENGYGVCRNMANDIARKLNEINPDYNARTAKVYMGDDGIYQIADIKRTVIESNQTTLNETSNNENTNDTISKILGNHEVTLVDVKKDNIIIVLDPTNPGIGIYKNGKIEMLNSGKDNGTNYETRKMSEFITANGYKELAEVAEDYAESYKKSKLSPEEIEEKYGLNAQNQALKEVRKMAKNAGNSIKVSAKKEFKDKLRVESLGETEYTPKVNDEEKDITR